MNKYNETEKVLLLKAYIESGMSYCSFARSHNIPVSSFLVLCFRNMVILLFLQY